MKRIGMVIGGRAHPFEACARIFKEAVEAGGRFSVEVTSDRSVLVDPSGYDAVVMYTVGGEMSREQERGLVDYVRGGGGLLAIHCANADMERFEDYIEMVGTAFVEHGPVTAFTVETDEDAGDILPRLSGRFTVTDEFYLCRRCTEATLRTFQHGAWRFERHTLGYVRDYGEGRVFYTALGHDERTFRHPDFQDTVYKGLRYVCGMKEDKTIRVGLLGYGPAFNMGRHHAGQVEATRGFELRAVCDRDPARLEAARQELGGDLATFTEAEEMAGSGEIDLGVVILPHAYHALGIRTFLKAGVHAITEKPFAVTVAECDEAIALAREKGLMLSVYHNRHWDGDILTLRHVVESGRIGAVYSIECNMGGYGHPGQSWRSHKPVSGGALYDWGVHQFEKILQLVPWTDAQGAPINRRASLYGHFLKKVWHDVTNEDYVRAYVRFDGGVEAQMTESSICAAPKPRWVVLGTRGAVVMDRGATVTAFDEAGRRHTTEIEPFEARQPYYKHLADHLLAGAPLVITPEWARGAIQCIAGCEIAARENRVVEVAFDF